MFTDKKTKSLRRNHRALQIRKQRPSLWILEAERQLETRSFPTVFHEKVNVRWNDTVPILRLRQVHAPTYRIFQTFLLPTLPLKWGLILSLASNQIVPSWLPVICILLCPDLPTMASVIFSLFSAGSVPYSHLPCSFSWSYGSLGMWVWFGFLFPDDHVKSFWLLYYWLLFWCPK